MKRLFRKGKENRASITVEAATSLLLFTFVMLFLLSFIDISRAQAKIQNAVDKAALEISEYMYLYQAFGLYNLDAAMHSAGDSAEKTLDKMVASADDGILGVETIFHSLQDTVDSVSKGDRLTKEELVNKYREISGEGSNITASYEAIKNEFSSIKDDPIGFAKSLGAMGVSFGMDKLKSYVIGSVLAKNMTVKYIGAYYAEDEKDKDPDYEKIADARLKSWRVVDGVEGLDFRGSNIFSDDSPQDINIVVTYEVNVFKLLGNFKLRYAQSASTQAWLGGDCTTEIAQNERAQLPPAAEGGSLEDTLPTSAPTPTPTPTPTPVPEEPEEMQTPEEIEQPDESEQPEEDEEPEEPDEDEREKMKEATIELAKRYRNCGYYWYSADGTDFRDDQKFEDYYDKNDGTYVFFGVDINGKTNVYVVSCLYEEDYCFGYRMPFAGDNYASVVQEYKTELKDKFLSKLPRAKTQVVLTNITGHQLVYEMPVYSELIKWDHLIVSQYSWVIGFMGGIYDPNTIGANVGYYTYKSILGDE